MTPHHPGSAAPRAVLALDIGGTKLAAGVVAEDGTVLSSVTRPTERQEGPDAVLTRLFALGADAVTRAGSPGPLLGVGIGCGGPLDPVTGVLLAPPHLPGWHDVPVTALAEAAFGLPAVLDNDGTAGAAGEWRFGAGGASAAQLVYLTVSTGIGGGLVIDGRTYRGAAGNGGEPGHVTVRTGGRTCRSCGRRGCLEAYASGTAIAERAAEALREPGAPETLGGAREPTAADVARAAREGEPLAVRLWDETTDALAEGLTSIVNLYEPELVVLGGGVTRAGDQLLLPIRERVAGTAMPPAARAVRIVLAGRGELAGVLGAAAIAFERLGTLPAPPVTVRRPAGGTAGGTPRPEPVRPH